VTGRVAHALALAGALLVLTPPGRGVAAEERGPGRAHALRFDPAVVAFEVMGTVALSAAAFTAPIDHDTCRWCDPPGFDVSVRDALVAPDTELAAGFGDGLAWGGIPLAAGLAVALPPLLGHADDRLDAAENLVMVADAVLLTLALVEFPKNVVARERPYAHFGAPVEYPVREHNLSFPSAHSAAAFALAASATTVSFLRGYDSAPWVAAGGGALAVTTGLLRIAADRHWATDVLVGMAVGTSIGIALPLLLHPRVGSGDDGASARPGVVWRLAATPPGAGLPPTLLVSGCW